MEKQKTIKGLTVEYGGRTIDNVLSVYIDYFDKPTVSFSYYENGNDNIRVNVSCGLNEVKINIA